MENLQRITGNEVIEMPQPTVSADMFERFTAYIDAAPKTVETYTKALRQFYSYISFNGIARPQRADVIAFRDELERTAHKPTTRQNYITAVKQFFKWTESEGLYPNIATNLKGAKLDQDFKKDYLTSRQVKEILSGISTDTMQGIRDYAMLSLMVTCGLRTIEVSRANIEDMRTLGDNTVLYIQGKGREEKAEYVKISAPVEKAIRSYLKTRKEKDGKAPLFASLSNNSKGGRISTRSVSGTVKHYMQAAGYDSDRLTAHSLRHTAVTLSILAGKDTAEVQQFARHKSIATTMIYNHALDRAKNGCSDAIAAAIF